MWDLPRQAHDNMQANTLPAKHMSRDVLATTIFTEAITVLLSRKVYHFVYNLLFIIICKNFAYLV